MPSPWTVSKSGTEHGEQAALFCFINVACSFGWDVACDPLSYTEKGYAAAHPKAVAMPDLHWIHAIPNGGSRGSNKREAQMVGSMMKAEGVTPGVSDICVPIPMHGKHGLYIEMKREDGGTVSKEQKAFGAFALEKGYGFCVCYGWLEAARVIMRWMGHPEWRKLA